MPKQGDRKEEAKGERMIHVRLPADLHRKLRIKAAELDTTIQGVVEDMIRRELGMK